MKVNALIVLLSFLIGSPLSAQSISDNCPDIWTQYFPDKRISGIAISNDTAWMTTQLPEVVQMTDSGFVSLNSTNTPLLENELVTAIVAARNGGIILGMNNLLAQFDGQNWVTFDADDAGMELGQIVEILELDNGELWLGSNLGLIHKIGNTWEKFDVSNSNLTENEVKSIGYINNFIAVGTNNTLHLFELPLSLTSTSWNIERAVRDILFTPNMVCQSTSEGFVKSNYYTEEIFTMANSGLPSDDLQCLAVDENGAIWIGTAAGLVRYFEEEWKVFTTQNSDLAHNSILSIAIVGGSMVIGTPLGISVLVDHYAAFGTREGCTLAHTLTNTSRNLSNFSWYLDGNWVADTKDLSYTFPDYGDYEVTLVGFDAQNCSSSFEGTVKIGPKSDDFEMRDSVTVWADSVVLDANYPGMNSYIWSNEFISDFITIGDSSVLTVRESGDYFIWLWDNCYQLSVERVIVTLLGEAVYPGDMNYDGIVDVYDVQVYNFAYGQTGAARPNPSLNWEQQFADPWSGSLPSGVNFKHCDANGDGLVDEADLAAIEQNYGQTHETGYNKSAASNLAAGGTIAMSFGEETVKITKGLKLTTVPVFLESAENELVGGASFVIENNAITPMNFVASDTSFLAGDLNAVSFSKNFPSKIAIGLSRVDGQGRIVNGLVGHLIIEELDIETSNPSNIQLSGESGSAMDNIGSTILIVEKDTLPTNLFRGNPTLALNFWLEGAYEQNSGLMRNTLMTNRLLPLAPRLNKEGKNDWKQAKPNTIVDWVQIELSTAEQPSLLVIKQAAFLLQDGQVVNPNGEPLIQFTVPNGNYFVTIKHRNHLSASSATPIRMETGSPASINFSLNDAYHTASTTGQILIDNKWMLLAGEANQDSEISTADKYILLETNGISNVYHPADFNLDGVVDDVDKILWGKNNGIYGGWR